jgi:hypothetical protein
VEGVLTHSSIYHVLKDKDIGEEDGSVFQPLRMIAETADLGYFDRDFKFT